MNFDIYKCFCSNVVDGDTIKINFILEQFYLKFENISCRLNRINADELGTISGFGAFNLTKNYFFQKNCLIKFCGFDKYGRHLIELYFLDEFNNLQCFNDFLVKNNYAQYVNY